MNGHLHKKHEITPITVALRLARFYDKADRALFAVAADHSRALVVQIATEWAVEFKAEDPNFDKEAFMRVVRGESDE